MTAKADRTVTFMRGALPLAAALALAACGTSQTAEPPMAVNGPVNTGTYPNLNIPPKAAAPQLTDGERAARMAELEAAQRRQGPGTVSESPEERQRRLRLLAERHGSDTLYAIENP